MPFFREKPGQDRDAKHGELVKALIKEFDREQGDGPVIIEEPVQASDLLHVYVIWDRFRDVREEHRSAAILDAYQQQFGEETMKRVSIAMGLTQAEADAMGIPPRPRS